MRRNSQSAKYILFYQRSEMRMRSTIVTALLCLTAITAYAADNPNVGTWKLNTAKSKFASGAPKNNSVTYTAEGDQYKCVLSTTGADGKSYESTWVGKFDGKQYGVTGDPQEDSRGMKMSDAKHYRIAVVKGGKTVET